MGKCKDILFQGRRKRARWRWRRRRAANWARRRRFCDGRYPTPAVAADPSPASSWPYATPTPARSCSPPTRPSPRSEWRAWDPASGTTPASPPSGCCPITKRSYTSPSARRPTKQATESSTSLVSYVLLLRWLAEKMYNISGQVEFDLLAYFDEYTMAATTWSNLRGIIHFKY